MRRLRQKPAVRRERLLYALDEIIERRRELPNLIFCRTFDQPLAEIARTLDSASRRGEEHRESLGTTNRALGPRSPGSETGAPRPPPSPTPDGCSQSVLRPAFLVAR